MSNYYVSLLANNNGKHEIHTANCSQFPDFEDVLAIGEYTHVNYALKEARKIFPQSVPCEHCVKIIELEGVA